LVLIFFKTILAPKTFSCKSGTKYAITNFKNIEQIKRLTG